MGIVYLVRQTDLGRMAALKMILAGPHTGPEHRDRFHTEATAVARLQHPRIVQIYDVGEHDGRPFMLLEYVAGGSLARKLAGTPLPARQAAELVRSVALAMHYAHQRGVIHRDLTPGNVLLTPEGEPKVTDFGLAKLVAGTAHRTQTGAVLGTPSYMAPEQAAGQSRTAGPSADVYALGAILYECLTGRPPFRATTALDTLLQAIADEPVPPRRLQPQVPRDLDVLCLKCLSKEPHRRYESAAALAADLDRFLDNKPITARPAGTWERSWRWARRNPRLALASGLAVVSLLAATTLSLVLYAREARNAEQLGRANQEIRAQTDTAQEHLRRARAETAKGVFAQGLSLLEQGEAGRGPGLLCLARGLEMATLAGDADLERLLRNNLAGWARPPRPLIRWQHHGLVEPAAFSPDGKTVLTVEGNATPVCWDSVTGKPVIVPFLARLRGRVRAVAVSPAGQSILVATEWDDHHYARLWEVHAGEPASPTLPHIYAVHGAAFSPDGRSVVTLSGEAQKDLWEARLWHLPAAGAHTQMPEAATQVGPPRGGEGPAAISRAAFSPDSRIFVTANAQRSPVLGGGNGNTPRPAPKAPLPHPRPGLQSRREDAPGVYGACPARLRDKRVPCGRRAPSQGRGAGRGRNPPVGDGDAAAPGRAAACLGVCGRRVLQPRRQDLRDRGRLPGATNGSAVAPLSGVYGV
jgi:hypothetical protein